MKLAAQELVVHAPIEQLFELLVDPELFVLWMADDATLDTVPGGIVRWTHPNGDSCSGRYLEVVPPTRVVFTYGWERADWRSRPGPRQSRSTWPRGRTDRPTSASCTEASKTPPPTPHQGGWATTSTGCAAPPRARRSARTRGPIGGSRHPRNSANHDPHTRHARGAVLALADPLLAQAGVTRSTMMGLPCLRIDGQFFASFDRRTGHLLVKLPQSRVDELVHAERAHSFAPAGRRFRQWAAIAPTRRRAWTALLEEALAFVASHPAAPNRATDRRI